MTGRAEVHEDGKTWESWGWIVEGVNAKSVMTGGKSRASMSSRGATGLVNLATLAQESARLYRDIGCTAWQPFGLRRSRGGSGICNIRGRGTSPGAVAHARRHCRTTAGGRDSFERAIRRGARAACRVENGVIHGRPAPGIAWCPLQHGARWLTEAGELSMREAPGAQSGRPCRSSAVRRCRQEERSRARRWPPSFAAFAGAGGKRASLPPEGGGGIGSRRHPAGHGGRRERPRPSRGRVRRGSFRRA